MKNITFLLVSSQIDPDKKRMFYLKNFSEFILKTKSIVYF